ncbi:hypothetical protein C2W62_42300, partial [Candidatus Entotheonella serta]
MRIRFLCLIGLLCIGISTRPCDAKPHIRMVPDSGIRLEMQPVYNVTPISGFLPLRITLANNSGRSRTWHFRATQQASGSNSGSSRFTQSLTVPHQSEQTFEVYVPILSIQSGGRSWRYKNFRMALTGYGIHSATLRSHASINHQSLPYIAMSDALHLRSWPVMRKGLKKQKVLLYGSNISPDNMLRQWRGYAGIWRLLITVEEWDRLPAEVHRAVVDWVLMGGELHLFHRHQLPDGSRDYGGFRFEGITTGHHVQQPLGLGRVALPTWDGLELHSDYQTTLQIDAKRSTRSAHDEDLSQAYTRQTWPFFNRMPTQRFTEGFLWVLGAFLLLYFVLVGPFNVWRAAKRDKRLHLFFTTPALAVVSSMILCALLAMHAGFGAWGFRTTSVYLLPNQPKAMVIQEQITKTAFMLQTAFRVLPDRFITLIPLDKVPGKY